MPASTNSFYDFYHLHVELCTFKYFGIEKRKKFQISMMYKGKKSEKTKLCINYTV